MMHMHPIVSSNLAEAGYDPETRRMRVRFRDRVRKKGGVTVPGGIYETEHTDENPVDQGHLDALLAAESAGTHYHAHLRHLDWRKVEDEAG